jgi:hypothetical protein
VIDRVVAAVADVAGNWAQALSMSPQRIDTVKWWEEVLAVEIGVVAYGEEEQGGRGRWLWTKMAESFCYDRH